MHSSRKLQQRSSKVEKESASFLRYNIPFEEVSICRKVGRICEQITRFVKSYVCRCACDGTVFRGRSRSHLAQVHITFGRSVPQLMESQDEAGSSRSYGAQRGGAGFAECMAIIAPSTTSLEDLNLCERDMHGCH